MDADDGSEFHADSHCIVIKKLDLLLIIFQILLNFKSAEKANSG
jgi:hypothetical protein